jgi:hypothetical protein
MDKFDYILSIQIIGHLYISDFDYRLFHYDWITGACESLKGQLNK